MANARDTHKLNEIRVLKIWQYGIVVRAYIQRYSQLRRKDLIFRKFGSEIFKNFQYVFTFSVKNYSFCSGNYKISGNLLRLAYKKISFIIKILPKRHPFLLFNDSGKIVAISSSVIRPALYHYKFSITNIKLNNLGQTSHKL